MKAIVCEMCGSQDLVKQDGVYVCQNCGTKYSVEEAKKMMIEGTVDVSGSTVKIDSSSELDNLYELARRAKDSNNYKNAAKYYDQILIKDPSSWEANLYSTCYGSFDCKVGELASSANKVKSAIPELLKVANKIEEVKERKRVISEICSQIKITAKTLGETSKSYSSTQGLSAVIAAGEIKPALCDDLINLYLDDSEIFPEICIPIIKETIYGGLPDNTFNRWTDAIKKYNPEYIPPQKTKAGCYVATAVYGSYDCPQVWTLRRYRDFELAETWQGRTFIRTYYAISPTLVKLFGNAEWFKKMWRGKLDRMVSRLQKKGYDSTPYEDRKW